MRRRRAHSGHAQLVLERMRILYSIALEAARSGDLEYARMLTGLIRRLATRNRVRPPKGIKRGICKNCGAPLIPGVTARVRLRSQGRRFAYRVIVCLECGWIHRYPYKPYKSRLEGRRGGGGLGKPQGRGEEGPPLQPGRDHRQEGDNGGSDKGDKGAPRG